MHIRNNRKAGARGRYLCCVAALLIAGPSYAKPLDILGTRIDLPFDYEVVNSSENISYAYNGSVVSQRISIKLADGSANAEKVVVLASYFSPNHPDVSGMKASQRRQMKKAAALPGVRSTATLHIDGFDFGFIDGPTLNKTYPQAVQMIGVMDGPAYRLQIAAQDTRPLTPQLVERIKAIHLDSADLMKYKPSLDAEAAEAVKGKTLETPIGNVTVPENFEFNLAGSLVERDGTGALEFRRRTFRLVPPYNGSPQSVRLPQFFMVSMGCGRLGALEADDYNAFVQMTEEHAIDDPYRKFTNFKMKDQQTLLGLPAQVSTASGQAVDSWRLHDVDVRRWAAKKDGDWFMVEADRYNGAPIENPMIKQLAMEPAVCLLDLPFGSDPSPVSHPATSQSTIPIVVPSSLH